MQIGFLTTCMGKRPLPQIVQWAGDNGFSVLEISSSHLDPPAVLKDGGKAVRKLLADHGVAAASVAHYANVTPADADDRKAAAQLAGQAIEAAALIEAPIVCGLAGMPQPGKTKEDVIKSDVAAVWQPLCEQAAKHGIKIAFENWYATLLQNLPMWRLVFQQIGADNCGLNFDPSHLYHQQIDYLGAVDEFAPRIFHTHGKDTEIRPHVLRDAGNQAGGWWRYVIPGYGQIDWGPYIARLRANGYDGVLSIEHEDSAFGIEEGLVKGKRHLELFA